MYLRISLIVELGNYDFLRVSKHWSLALFSFGEVQ